MDAFELKTRAALKQLDDEAQALAETPFSIGHITLGCALGYLDYRFDALGWRAHGAPPGRVVRDAADTPFLPEPRSPSMAERELSGKALLRVRSHQDLRAPARRSPSSA